MLKRLAILGIFATAILAAAPRAEAIPITGGISFFGIVDPTGGVGNLWSAGTTGMNFGPALTTIPTGTYAFLGVTPGTSATFTNFSFGSQASPLLPAPVTPLWSFVSGGNTFTFDMLSVQAAQFVPSIKTFGLVGTGILNISGGVYNATPGTFAFTSQFSGNNPGPLFSFSADNTANAVPEPGSMMLLGSGLIGLATAARRRFANGRR